MKVSDLKCTEVSEVEVIKIFSIFLTIGISAFI